MKYIFLDIDGVLNSVQNHHRLERLPDYNYNEWKEDHRFWDPMCISNLKYILDLDPEIKLILHSWWRTCRSLAHTKICFEMAGLPSSRLIADTSHYLDKPQSIMLYIGNEILKSNNIPVTSQGVPVFPNGERVVVFDDVDLRLPGIQIQINDLHGLTLEDARLACRYLNIEDTHPSMRLH